MCNPCVLRRGPVMVAAVVLALILAAAPGFATGFDAEEGGLTVPGMVLEINGDGTGQLFVSEYDAHQVWRVDVVTGAYTRYTVPDYVVDARADAEGNIWFTDATRYLSRINTAANPVTVTRWNFMDWDAEPESPYNLNGLAFDGNGDLWITEWESRYSRLYRLNPGTGELCGYTLSYGSASYYVLTQGPYVWLVNLNQDRAVRFDPIASTRTWWQLPPAAAEGLALDATGNLWWADSEANELGRLEPDLKTVTTWALPVGTTPHMVKPTTSGIWYTAGSETSTGTVGVLDPAAVPLPTFSGEVQRLTYPVDAPMCAPVGAGSILPVTVDTGTLPWAANDWTTVLDEGGWTVYELPSQSIPYGLALEAGRAWASDYGRQKLARTGSSGLAAPVLGILTSGSDVLLSWNTVSGASFYQVWRSESPYFPPSGLPFSETAATSVPDYGVAGDALHNYIYIVRAVNSSGLPSVYSSRVAEFTFGLVAGTTP